MTDLQTALAHDPNLELPSYQGRPTARTSIAIRNAGDGLSEAMAIEPEVLTQGSTVHVVLECRVGPHDFVPLLDKGKDLGMNELKQVLVAGTAVIIDSAVVKEMIDDQARRVAEAKSAAAEAAKAAKGEPALAEGMGLNGDDPEND